MESVEDKLIELIEAWNKDNPNKLIDEDFAGYAAGCVRDLFLDSLPYA